MSSLFSYFIRLQWVPDIYSTLLVSPSSSLLYPLLSFFGLQAYCLIKFFDTQVSSIFTKALVLASHARCVLSPLRCKEHSHLLSSYLSRIENPSCSACGDQSQDTSHLTLHCPATDSLSRSLFGDSLSLRHQAHGSCPASGVLWSSIIPPSIGKCWVRTSTTTTTATKWCL